MKGVNFSKTQINDGHTTKQKIFFLGFIILTGSSLTGKLYLMFLRQSPHALPT
jgi:hypothetical protein